jgi:hypothetical protein
MALDWKLTNGKTLGDIQNPNQCFAVCMVMNAVGVARITPSTVPVIVRRQAILAELDGRPLSSSERETLHSLLAEFDSLEVGSGNATAKQFLDRLGRRVNNRDLALPKN